MRLRPIFRQVKNERGMVLVTSLLILAVLVAIGTTIAMQTSTDIKISSNYKTSRQAFYDADAGVQYAIAKIKADSTFTLPSAGSSVPLTYATPAGFSFTLSTLSKNAGSNTYSFTSTGNGSNNAQAAITATFGRDSAINFAAFGDQKMDTKNGGSTQSYDSSSLDPTKNDPSSPSYVSTHEADVGSNDWLVTHNGASIDGSGVFGEQDDGSATTNDIHSGTTFYGTAGVTVGRVDPDPLGVNSGGEYDPFTYATSNDNASAGVGTTISTKGSITLTAGDYYFTSITLKNGADLTIDTSAGPVNIFLTGGIDFKNGSTIDVTGSPTDFSIYSNSTSKIDFKHSSEFEGFVYAPFADIDIKNSASVYGAIWGSSVDIKNSGTLYYDTALKDKYSSNNLTLTAWKDESL